MVKVLMWLAQEKTHILIFIDRGAREIKYMVGSVRLSILFDLSKLNHLTYDIDFWYWGHLDFG